MKKFVFIFVFVSCLFFNLPLVYASANIQARIGNSFFDTLEEAISAAGADDTIILTTNVTSDKTLLINKNVNINLNGNTISAEEQVFLVQGGSLNLKGKGTIKETKPNYGAIMIKGATDPTKKDFSTVSVEKDIILEGWSGIFINHNNKTGYGILVNMNGSINAINDINGGTGAGIYVNGYIKNQNNAPIINLSNTVNIKSTGVGIYSAGYSTYNINGATISGVESGLAIKSGIFNILDANITGTGEDKTPTTGNNNGINPSGVAIQIESNNGYAGDIVLKIKDGTFTSYNSNVIYEYTTNNSNTKIKDINISGGTFISKKGKDVFNMSNSFKSTHPKFVSGGIYSSNPTNELETNYSTIINDDNLYEVTQTTMKTTIFKEQKSHSTIWLIIPIIFLAIIVIAGYLYKDRIIELIKKDRTIKI